jgi:aminopeptidase N
MLKVSRIGPVQVVNKWLVLQAMSDIPGNVNNVKALLDHPAFDIKNPNKVCIIFSIFMSNPDAVVLLRIHQYLFFEFFDFLVCANNSPTGMDCNVLKVYSLVGGFCGSAVNFHAKDGTGYQFLGNIVLELDKINPQVRSYDGNLDLSSRDLRLCMC